MKKYRLVLHIGSPKCASTFLQTQIFNKAKGVNYLNQYEPIKTVLSDLHAGAMHFNINLDDFIDPNKVNVLSDEHLCFFGGGERLSRIAKLQSFVGDAEILYIIRNQKDLMKSFFGSMKQYSGISDEQAFDLAFLFVPMREVSENIFNFYKTVKEFEQYFSDVQVITLESISNPENLRSILNDRFGMKVDAIPKIKVNQRLTRRHLFVRRYLPRIFFPSFLGNSNHFGDRYKEIKGMRKLFALWSDFLRNGSPSKAKTSKRIEEYIERRYAKCNDALDSLKNLNLSQLGYPSEKDNF